MKIFILCYVLLFTVYTGSERLAFHSVYEQLEFTVRRERTGISSWHFEYLYGEDFHLRYPAVILSAEELARHIEPYSGWLAFVDRYGISHYANDVYFGRYTEDFFAENFLILFILKEGSISISHTVESVNSNGVVRIRRTVPDMGQLPSTGAWHMFIELCNSVIPEQIHLVMETSVIQLSD